MNHAQRSTYGAAGVSLSEAESRAAILRDGAERCPAGGRSCQCQRSLQRGQGNTHCPLPGHEHGDRQPSLAVNRPTRKKDGNITPAIYCPVHRDDFGELVEYYRALGMWNDTSPHEHPKPIAIYPYRDRSGRRYRKLRYAVGKPYRWEAERVDGHGYRACKGEPADLLPYRFDKLPNGGVVISVEGEKDADTCWRLGLPATCAPHGSAPWKPEYTADLLAIGCFVVVLRDEDAAGHRHAQEKLESLPEDRRRLVVLPGLTYTESHGSDVTDWMMAHTREELIAVIGLRQCDACDALVPPSRSHNGMARTACRGACKVKRRRRQLAGAEPLRPPVLTVTDNPLTQAPELGEPVSNRYGNRYAAVQPCPTSTRRLEEGSQAGAVHNNGDRPHEEAPASPSSSPCPDVSALLAWVSNEADEEPKVSASMSQNEIAPQSSEEQGNLVPLRPDRSRCHGIPLVNKFDGHRRWRACIRCGEEHQEESA